MKVFHRFTLRSLRKNRVRTIVTIIGIVLSMSMFTAVTEVAGSLLSFLERTEIERGGAYHGAFLQLEEEQKQSAEALRELSSVAVWQTVGWADVGSENEYKPYLLIRSVGRDFTDLVAVRIKQGRMPENEHEILLPEHLESNGGVRYEIGETLTLSVGERTISGDPADEARPFDPDVPETLQNSVSKQYTVVGIYERFLSRIENYDCAGYTALTCGGGTGPYGVFFTMKHPSGFYKFMQEKQSITKNWIAHDDLLRVNGALRSGSLRGLLFGFAGVLLFLIFTGSVALIYNSFSISVAERIRQFGLLRSVGAGSAQIRSCVLYEALILGLIGIPIGMITGCAGIGITLWALREPFARILMGSSNARLQLVLRPDALLIAALICLITTLVSAWIPALRAKRVSPIDAIRQTKASRIRAKQVKTRRGILKIFGFEGMMALKNFKRDKKRYRATVASLFLSVTLFITAASFCTYLNDSAKDVSGRNARIDVAVNAEIGEKSTPQEIHASMSDLPDITDSAYFTYEYQMLRVDVGAISKEYKNAPTYRQPADVSEKTFGVQVVFLDDETFTALCRENETNVGKYFDKSIPQALVYDETSVYYTDEKGKDRWCVYKTIDSSAFPLSGHIDIEEFTMDGYELLKSEKDGKTRYLYYPKEYLTEIGYYENDVAPDESKAIEKSREEVVAEYPVRLGKRIEEMPFCLDENGVVLIYPYRMKNVVLPAEKEPLTPETVCFAFRTPRHAEVMKSIDRQLQDHFPEVGYELSDLADGRESTRALLLVINVFSYGFIILISLIAASNVFNTISTNIALRKREFAMLRSVGLSPHGFRRMMNLECIIYGSRGLFWGLVAATALTYLIFRMVSSAVTRGFYMPWHGVVIAVVSVFLVVFATMLYATRKIRKGNVMDALKNENI